MDDEKIVTAGKICLIQAPSRNVRPVSRGMMGGLGFGTGEQMILPPLDLMVMAAVARKNGREVRIIDADLERLDAESAARLIREYGADMCVGTVSLPTLNSDCKFLRELAERSGLPVYAKTFVREPEILEEILKKSSVRLAMIGEPDFSLIPILDGESAEGTARLEPDGRLTVTPYRQIETLDDLPVAARDLVSHGRYVYPLLGTGVATMQTSRGCPYPCGYYCPYPMIEGKKWRPMSPPRVMEEMRTAASQGLKKILFRDATFTLNRARILELCRLLIESGLKTEWWCETRADLLDEELLERMSLAGCRGVNVGVESGNEELISTLGKRGLTLEQLALARRAASRFNVRMHFLMQVGLPGETRETILDSLDLLRNLNPDSIGLTFTTPYPGTELYRAATEKGWMSAKNWEDFDAHTPVLRTEKLSVEELTDGRRMVETGYDLIRAAASEREWNQFYIESLQWTYELSSGRARMWVRRQSAGDRIKKILRPAWRLLPARLQERVRKLF